MGVNGWLNVMMLLLIGAGLYNSADGNGSRFGFTGLLICAGFLFAGGGLMWLWDAVRAVRP